MLPLKVKTDPGPNLHQVLRLSIEGIVQGVGFRPFVYALAQDLGLAGWIRNNAQGVEIEIAGPRNLVRFFLQRLQDDKPPHASYENFQTETLKAKAYSTFEILPSEGGKKTALVLPDYATCSDCLREVFDPKDRRYRYPFTNCTHCGPRFSILNALPYDRPNTTMQAFPLCAACQQEYEDPTDRRFHAQPNACPDCGPQLALWDLQGKILASKDEALEQAASLLRQGKILALKGLGGFHLLVDARNTAAVQRLRERKKRPHKPFATMFPTLGDLADFAEISSVAAKTLFSAAAPIVLLNRRATQHPTKLAAGIAPGLNLLGAMLPSTPLHHLLMKTLGFPVVATSGNRSAEPICIDERGALARLGGIADVFLVHNRPIARPVDDSVVRFFHNEVTVLRRSRGYAPLPLTGKISATPILAVGAHLKNTIALQTGPHIFLSQHIGDLASLAAQQAFQEIITRFKEFYEVQPKKIMCDLHPDYASTQYAEAQGIPLQRVQHHHAHVASLMTEHDLTGPVLGVAWDGTGHGGDGTLWGSEFLKCTGKDFQRLAHWRYFPLLGGEKAIAEPRRVALGILFAMMGKKCFQISELPLLKNFSNQELRLLKQMLEKKLQTPKSCGMGRLFDAVAALLEIRLQQSFAGQAAMELESLAQNSTTAETYPLEIHRENTIQILDWEPMVQKILSDRKQNVSPAEIAKKFHNTLAHSITKVATAIGEARVLLTGGCFQNKILLETSITHLQASGFQVYWHQNIPPNDGGIALGQAKVGELCV